MSNDLIKGKVWKYGDNINTDIISPPAYMELSISEAAKYAMSPIDPDFGKAFKEGDLLVAENNFGSGSSRETAPLTLRHLGVRVIIAKSFARIFYRNAINLGILALESQEAGKISQDDVLEIDYKAGIIKNITRDERYTCTIMPDHIMTIIDAGGLVTYLKAKKKTQ